MRKKKLFNLLCSAALAAGMSMNTVLPAFADETVAQEESTEALYSTGYTGLLNKGNNHWEYVINGATQTGYTGLVNYYGTWYYIEKGVLDWGYTGLTNYYGTWYYVENGVLNLGYTGLTNYYGTWYYVENGILNWNYTGLTNYYGTWYYVEKGILNWNYTGLTNYYNTWYYVEKGVLNWNYTGLTNYYNTWYYVEKGVLNWNYTGLTNYYGTLYYVQNGVMGWNYNSSITYNGTLYTIQNSIAYPANLIPSGAALLQLGRRYSCWDDSDFIDTTMWGGHWNDMYYYTPVPQTINIEFIGRYSFFYIDRENGENYYTLTAVADPCDDPRFSDQIYLEAGTYVIKTSVGIFHAAGSMIFTITVKQ